MAANTNPIFPLTPYINTVSPVTACTTRGSIATADLGTNNLVELCPVTDNGKRVDKIQVKACSSSMTATSDAMIVGIWDYDGTNAFLIDEIIVSAVVPNTTTTPSFVTVVDYTNFVLPASHKLYCSTTVTTTTATTALQVTVFGGNY